MLASSLPVPSYLMLKAQLKSHLLLEASSEALPPFLLLGNSLPSRPLGIFLFYIIHLSFGTFWSVFPMYWEALEGTCHLWLVYSQRNALQWKAFCEYLVKLLLLRMYQSYGISSDTHHTLWKTAPNISSVHRAPTFRRTSLDSTGTARFVERFTFTKSIYIMHLSLLHWQGVFRSGFGEHCF